jgi:hypothetical protein
VQHAVTLVQYHLPRLYRDVVSEAVVPDHLQRPRLVDVLRDVDDGARDERQAVDVRAEYGSGRVLPYAVQGRGRQLLAGPLLEGVPRHLPYHVLELGSGPRELVVVEAEHPSMTLPLERGGAMIREVNAREK